MKAQTVVTWSLVGLTMAVGGYLLFIDKNAPTTGEIEQRKSNLLKLFRPDQLTEIAIRRDGDDIRLSRATASEDAGDARLWRVEEKGRAEVADQFAVDKALSALEFAFPVRTMKPEAVDRAAMGLAPPRLMLTLTMGGRKTRLQVGGPAPVPEGSVYVDVDGAVSVVKKDTFAPVDLPAEAYRTRTVVPYLSSDLERMGFSVEDKSYELVRGPGTTWRFTPETEGGSRVDRFVLDKMLTAFAELKADSFLTEEDARKAQAGQRLVTVSMLPREKAKPRGEFTLGGACPGHPDDVVVVRPLPQAIYACTARGVLDALSVPARELADRHPFSFREDEIEEIQIQEGDKKLEIARKDKGWHQRAPVDADVALDAARTLVKGLASVKGSALSREPSPALDPPRARVTLAPTADPKLERPRETVVVGREEKDGRVPIRREQDGLVLRVTREEARGFLARSNALRSTRVIDETVDHVRSMSVTGEGRAQSLERGKDGSWTLLEPRGFPVDIAVAQDLAEAACHLTADQWVAEQDDGSFGLSKPRLRLELGVDGGGDAGVKVYKVLFGETGPLGLYGKLEGEGGVFVLPRSAEQKLSALAIDLTVFMVFLADVESLTLRSQRGQITLVPQKEQYHVAPGGPDLPASRLDDFRDALQALHAEAVVHTGPPRKVEGFDKPSLDLRVKRLPGRGEHSKDVHITLGAADAYQSSSVYYAVREGIDAVYALPASRVRTLLDLL